MAADRSPSFVTRAQWARALDPKMIATTCSPTHIQSVIEEARGHIVALEAERDALAGGKSLVELWNDLPPAERAAATRAIAAGLRDGGAL